MAIRQAATPAAVGHHRRAEPLGERALVGGFERAATDEDHGTIRFCQQRGGALDRVRVERRRAVERQR
jgi:hypothetical protein